MTHVETVSAEIAEASLEETMTVTAARALAGKHRVFAGIGMPTLAVALAQQTVRRTPRTARSDRGDDLVIHERPSPHPSLKRGNRHARH